MQCSFCLKTEDEIGSLYVVSHAKICNECAKLALAPSNVIPTVHNLSAVDLEVKRPFLNQKENL